MPPPPEASSCRRGSGRQGSGTAWKLIQLAASRWAPGAPRKGRADVENERESGGFDWDGFFRVRMCSCCASMAISSFPRTPSSRVILRRFHAVYSSSRAAVALCCYFDSDRSKLDHSESSMPISGSSSRTSFLTRMQ